MSFLLKQDIHSVLTKIFYDDVVNRRSNYFYYVGKIVEWNDPNTPDVPKELGSYEHETRNNIINVKKIQPQDISFVIPRRNWESGTVYDQYDPEYSSSFKSDSGATSLKNATFYVLSAHQGGYYNVYKCLFNNGGIESTERPSGSDLTPITYADGYVWKYMYTIPLSLRNKFLTQDFIPVMKSVLNPYYSNGEVSSVVVDNRGSGYTGNAEVSLSLSCQFFGGSGNLTANLRPVLNDAGQFIDVLITEQGNNIKSGNVVITDTRGSGKSYYKQANSVIITNHGAGYVSAAASNTTVSVVSTGTQPNANALLALTFTSNEIYSISIINGGSGYTEAIIANTVVQISTSGNTQPTTNATANIYFNIAASFKPVIVDGKLQDVIILDPGVHYSSNNQTYVSLIGDGTGAKLTPYVNENGEVESVIIEERGSGYTYLDIDIIGNGANANAYADFYVGDINTLQSTVELSAIDGAVYALRIIDTGNGYSHANVSLLGDGTDFVGNCIIENNTISRVDVINPGRGYTHANVVISGDGSNAIATAILSPTGGHGKDAVREFFADTIMLYSTINNEKNHGLEVNNDYRQFGLIRNIEKFDNRDTFTSSIGSACYLVTLDDTSGLEADTKLRLSTNSNVTFNIVTISNDQVLLTNNNNYSIDNEVRMVDPDTNQSYKIESVDNEPTINKFSGDLISIDNRTYTSYTDQQLVTLKTVIKV